METKQTFKELKHFAYLTIDELKDFERLFDCGAKKLILSIRGRSDSGNKEVKRLDKIGITRISHEYVRIDADDIEISSKKELSDIVKKTKDLGLVSPYIVKMIIELNNGDAQIWERRVFHVKDKETQRSSGSQRLNALVLFKSTFEKARDLQNIYGKDLVQPTNCAKVIQQKEVTVCIGTMSEV